MPIKRPGLVNGETYHVVVRGVEKRDIFLDDKDRFRFVHDIFEFNDEKPVISTYRIRQPNITGSDPVILRKRRLLVEILAFCLMPNHFHLLLRQITNKGISEFMKKVNGGYAVYFNERRKRIGHLFQGRFKAVHIKNDDQLKNIFVYIHTNPIELLEKDWKERGIKSPKEAIGFLEGYRWSSYLDYIGEKNFPSITSRKLINEILGGPNGCFREIENWILYKRGLKEFDKEFNNIILE